MRMFAKILLGVLLAAGVAQAQSPVVVTGLITDAANNPATSGYVQFQLIPNASGIHYFVAGIGTVITTATCAINGTGQVLNNALTGSCTIWGNDVITPANTQYKITFAPNGTVTNVVSGECITGVAYSLNSPVFCPAVQVNPQQAIVRANPFATNVIPLANATFALGSPLAQWNGYFNQIFMQSCSGPGCSNANALLLSNNNWSGVNAFSNPSNAFNGGFTGYFTSNSANPATGGPIRLASSDAIWWRNGANNANCALSKYSSANGNVPIDTLLWECPSGSSAGLSASWFIADGVNSSVAASGTLRLHSGDLVCWRNNANNADTCLGKNSSDQLTFNDGLGGHVAGFVYDININSIVNGGGNFSGHYLRNNGTAYVDSTIPAGDLPGTSSNCTSPNFAQGLNAGGTPICNPVPSPFSALVTENVSGSFTTSPTQIGSNIVVNAPGGCTWRVDVAYSLFVSFSAAFTDFGIYVYDGTNKYAGYGSGPGAGTTGGHTSAAWRTVSNVTYASSTSSVTLGLYGVGSAGTTTITGTMPDGTTQSIFEAFGVCMN